MRQRRVIPAFLPLAFLSLATWLLSACAHAHRPPKSSEPHAVIKLRLTYHAWPAPLLEQSVTIDGDDVREIPQPTPQGAGGIATRQLLVRPGTVGCAVQATFFHNDVTSHAETYETSESAPCGSTTCMQTRPHTRLVNHLDRVDDATCTQGLRLTAENAESYVLEYDFLSDQQCTLKCHRQVRQPKGGRASVPCEGTAISRGKH